MQNCCLEVNLQQVSELLKYCIILLALIIYCNDVQFRDITHVRIFVRKFLHDPVISDKISKIEQNSAQKLVDMHIKFHGHKLYTYNP